VAISPKDASPKKDNFYRTMTAEEYKTFANAIKDAPQPKPAAAIMTAAKVERTAVQPLKETVILPDFTTPKPVETSPIPQKPPVILPPIVPEEPEVEQVTLEMPKEIPWRMVGELYNSYIIVEQGDEAFLIDKHAAHERILFEKLKANQEAISAQTLLTPIPVRLSPEAAGELLANRELLDELGFEIDEFGDQTVVLRQIPMDLSPADASDAVETLAADLLNGRRERKDSIRDELLHTVACKAAIKAGWHSDEKELLALAEKVMANEDLKYCPHGRPICITLSKKQLEKQFKRS
jgi:DNA mismatch repair protein MutL